MTQKQNAAMNQAIDLLINNDTDVSTLFKEDGLYAHKNHGACPVDVVLPISFCYGDVCRLENTVTVLTDVNII